MPVGPPPLDPLLNLALGLVVGQPRRLVEDELLDDEVRLLGTTKVLLDVLAREFDLSGVCARDEGKKAELGVEVSGRSRARASQFPNDDSRSTSSRMQESVDHFLPLGPRPSASTSAKTSEMQHQTRCKR